MPYSRFSVDTNAFRVEDVHIGAGYSAFEQFLSFWKEFGIFVDMNSDFLSLHKVLPDELRRKLDAVVKHMRLSGNRLEVSDVKMSDVIDDLFAKSFTNLDKARLQLIGLLEDIYTALEPPGGVLNFRPSAREEVCRIRDLALTETKANLVDLRSRDVNPNIPADSVWSDFVRPLFRANNLITVVDPYALRNFQKESAPLQSGLGFMLDRISRERTGIGRVEIHTAVRSTKNVDGAIEQVRAFNKGRNLPDVSLYIASNDMGGKIMHGRYFSGIDHTIDVDLGLEMFSPAPRRQAVHYAFKNMTAERARNSLLLRNARRETKVVNFT